MNPAISSLDYEGFIQKSSLEERRILRKLNDEWKKYYEPVAKERLIENIETDKKHHNLIKLCAKAFAETDLSINSGYEFYFAEPLIEFGHIEEGNKSFDLFLFNESDQSAIFIECKTSIPTRAKKILNEIEESKTLIVDKLEYLSNIIGLQIKPERIEYVLCVYDKDSRKIIDSLNKQAEKDEKNRIIGSESIKLWIYRPHSQLIQLYQNHIHSNQIITEMLLRGFGEDSLRNQFELPYCITTHPYRIIKLAIIGDCYTKNLHYENTSEPKIIKIDTIQTTLERNISMGISQEQKRELISEKLEKIIKYGEKYQLFEKINEEEIRLICRGNDIQVVKNNIESKFFKNWIKEWSDSEAKRKAIVEYKKRSGIQQLKDY